VILISVVVLALALLGLGMCRLAARGDDSQSLEVAQWLAEVSVGEPGEVEGQAVAESLHGPPIRRRATG
jgi:hypothetical protein